MTEIETPDVVVAGLGPAGSCAAAAAAAAGASVVALERRREAGTPVQCAEFVPALLGNDVACVSAVTQQPIARMLTYIEGPAPDETQHFPGRMIDRAAFDRLLASDAARAGARCRYETPIRRIDADGTIHTSDRRRLRPRILIGADGPHSRVGAAIGAINREIVATRQITVPLMRAHDATDIFLHADYRGGYAWLFPKGAVANLGLGMAPSARAQLKPLLAALHRELASSGRVGPQCLGLTGGAIPVGGRLRAIGALGSTHVLLAGDAAGLTNPVTGAGISAAVQSGTLAGRAAAARLAGDLDAIDDYEEELGALFDASLARALRRRRELLARYAHRSRPHRAEMRAGWIAYPEYWAA